MDFRNDGKEAIVSGGLGTEARYQLFIINTQAGSYKQVTHETSSLIIDPVFSPDGEKQWKLSENNFSEGWHDWSPDAVL